MTTPIPLPPEPALPTNALQRWQLTEPVRLYLYSVAIVVIAGLVLFGVITQELATYFAGVVAVVLVVGPGAEIARAAVYPIASVDRAALVAMRRFERER